MLIRICHLMEKDRFKIRDNEFGWIAIPKEKINQFNQLDFKSMSHKSNDFIGIWSKEFDFNLVDFINACAFTPHEMMLYSVVQDKFISLTGLLETISPKLPDAFKILVKLDDELHDAGLLCSVKSSIVR
jgi:hypothetical protein